MGDGITRLGIDLGGTKISAITLAPDGAVLRHLRLRTAAGDYDGTVRQIRDIVNDLAGPNAADYSVGIGIPGSISPASGLVQNANSTWLNGRPLKADVETALGCAVRIANDANCFALSEATDGAGSSHAGVFGVILGTGCGGGFVFNGRLVDGPRGIGGEWGHNPLPSPAAEEMPGPSCWCGRNGCIETWVSGPGLAADHARASGDTLQAEEIAEAAQAGCGQAQQTLERHASRLARSLACIVNVLDPDCIVLGGGLSNMAHLYDTLPGLMAAHIFAEQSQVLIVPPDHGDDSGVRGAAWLWNGSEGLAGES